MALGCLISIIVFKLRGERYQPISLEEEDLEEGTVEEACEKQEYVELPAYEAPPYYQDVPEKELDSQTK